MQGAGNKSAKNRDVGIVEKLGGMCALLSATTLTNASARRELDFMTVSGIPGSVFSLRGMLMAAKVHRKTFLVDRDVQGSLLKKAAGYWLLSLAVVGALNLIGWIFFAPGVDVLVQMREQLPSLFGTLLVALASSLIVLPVLLYDLAKHTNRFAGPIFRLQRSMKEIAAGNPVRPLAFRDGDYWQDLAENFNQIVTRLEAAEKQQNSDEVVEFDTLVAVNCGEEATSLR